LIPGCWERRRKVGGWEQQWEAGGGHGVVAGDRER